MRIALLGDIALIGRYDIANDANVNARVEYIRELVKDCDFVIANLESVLTDRTYTFACKGAYLRSNAKNVETLRYMGITHVTLANNHIHDYGQKGLRDTIATLDAYGIGYVGLNNKPMVLSKGSDKVLLDGFCCLSANALHYGNKSGKVRLLTYDALDSFLSLAEKEGCYPIASVHYGLEGIHYPATEHIEMFRMLAKKHSYVMQGNHPHAMQGYETIGDSLIVYAQGNLCFDRVLTTSTGSTIEENESRRKGYVVILEINNGKMTDYEIKHVTDLDDGILKQSDSPELGRYSDALKLPLSEIAALRKAELKEQSSNSQPRNAQFYLHRMNYKYIGAYINGILHNRKYKKLIMNQGEQ